MNIYEYRESFRLSMWKYPKCFVSHHGSNYGEGFSFCLPSFKWFKPWIQRGYHLFDVLHSTFAKNDTIYPRKNWPYSKKTRFLNIGNTSSIHVSVMFYSQGLVDWVGVFPGKLTELAEVIKLNPPPWYGSIELTQPLRAVKCSAV